MGKADRTKQFIIETAAPILNRKGIAGTVINDILEATGVAKGCLYGHFSSKEDIVMAVFDYIAESQKLRLQAVTSPETTAKGKLFALLDYYAHYPLNQQISGGCPVLNFGVEADDTHPALKKKVRDLILYFESRIEKIVQLGKANGEFHKHWNEEKFAIRMYTMLEGAILVTGLLNTNRQMLVVTDALKEEIQQHCH
ncbi:TetR/AcrR family transcriptional regulator [Chitinophaga vietnamensis]|uniref:TetR/AcrR family transcriptional regulator n=1 Tax=Chitinophaga vietnamensis TaxID=2593957 RepID=UPI0011779455|nr:TetR/AcrR family transcriptional regulator [Chitinophaga vietnamensis]